MTTNRPNLWPVLSIIGVTLRFTRLIVQESQTPQVYKTSDVMMHAVATDSRNWRGTAPCGAEDGPSRPEQPELPEPTAPLFRRKGETALGDAVTPRPSSARDRATDLMKATVPLPLMAALIASAVTIAAAMWRIESQIDIINERIAHNRELIELKEKALEDRFKMLEAKIETAGLRNSAMLLSQELAKKER